MPQLGAEYLPLRSFELIGSHIEGGVSDGTSGYLVNNHEKIPASKGLRRHSDPGTSITVMEWDFLPDRASGTGSLLIIHPSGLWLFIGKEVS